MQDHIRVVLYGKSLFIAGLALSLKQFPKLEVIRVRVAPANVRQRLEELDPAVIAFDIDETPADMALSLLNKHPDLLLLAFDSTKDRMIVLSSQPARTLTTDDLMQAIEAGINPVRAERPGPPGRDGLPKEGTV